MGSRSFKLRGSYIDVCISQTRPQGVNGYPSPGRRLTATYAQSNSGTCTNHVEMSSCYAAAQSVNLWSSQGGLDADYTQSEPPGCYRKESTGMVRFNLYTASTVQHDGTNFKGVCCVSGCGDDDTSAPTKSPTASPTAGSEDEEGGVGACVFPFTYEASPFLHPHLRFVLEGQTCGFLGARFLCTEIPHSFLDIMVC